MGRRKFTSDQARRATDLFFETGMSQSEVCRRLGYPSRPTLCRWVAADPRRAPAAREPRRATAEGEPGRTRADAGKVYPYEVRLEAVRLAEDGRLTRREVAERLGIRTPATVSKWVARARRQGKEALMPGNGKRGEKAAPGRRPTVSAVPDAADVEELLRQNAQLRMDNAILEETIKALKKDPGVDPSDLTNREKAAVVDALRRCFPLGDLLARVGLKRGTYYYERKAIAAGDKYAGLRERVARVFHC